MPLGLAHYTSVQRMHIHNNIHVLRTHTCSVNEIVYVCAHFYDSCNITISATAKQWAKQGSREPSTPMQKSVFDIKKSLTHRNNEDSAI